MTRQPSQQDSRSRQAERAWADLPHGGHDAVALQVHCAHSHHVAWVYRTVHGLVFAAPVRAHSHGSRDRVDEPHGPQPVDRWFDLLEAPDDAAATDALPAWCDCGPRTLSRTAVRSWLAAGEHRVVID